MTKRMLPWSAANRASVRANSGLPRKLICSVAVLAGGDILGWGNSGFAPRRRQLGGF